MSKSDRSVMADEFPFLVASGILLQLSQDLTDLHEAGLWKQDQEEMRGRGLMVEMNMAKLALRRLDRGGSPVEQLLHELDAPEIAFLADVVRAWTRGGLDLTRAEIVRRARRNSTITAR